MQLSTPAPAPLNMTRATFALSRETPATPQAGKRRLVLDQHIVTLLADSKEALMTSRSRLVVSVHVYSALDSFTVRGTCTVEQWSGWHGDGAWLARECVSWSAKARSLSSISNFSVIKTTSGEKRQGEKKKKKRESEKMENATSSKTTSNTSKTSSIGRNELAANEAHVLFREGSESYEVALQVSF
jgi:hypothetical protein